MNQCHVLCFLQEYDNFSAHRCFPHYSFAITNGGIVREQIDALLLRLVVRGSLYARLF